MAHKKIKETLGTIQQTLAARQANIRTRAVNLRNVKVVDYNHLEVDGIQFYTQPDDKLAIKQLCSAIGMSLGFYEKNPSTLNVEIFTRRLQGLDEDEGERMFRYIQTEQGLRLLAILPTSHQAPNYIDVIDPLADVLPEATEIRLTNHDHVDSEHRLSMRLSVPIYPIDIKPEDRQVGEPCEMGFFLDMSEDGRGGKMVMTGMVYNLSCTNGAMVSYDHHPYFEYNYRGIRAVDLGAAIKSVVGRFAGDVNTIKGRLIESEKNVMSRVQAAGYLRGLESRRDMSVGFLRKVRKQVDSMDTDRISRWRLVNMITQAAQSLPYDGRVQHEFVAGRLLGLDLEQEAA